MNRNTNLERRILEGAEYGTQLYVKAGTLDVSVVLKYIYVANGIGLTIFGISVIVDH